MAMTTQATTARPTTTNRRALLGVMLLSVTLLSGGVFWQLQSGPTMGSPALHTTAGSTVSAGAGPLNAPSEPGGLRAPEAMEPASPSPVLYLVATQEQADWVRRFTYEISEVSGQPASVGAVVVPRTVDADVMAGFPHTPGTRIIDLR
jgi:hypothetical protein